MAITPDQAFHVTDEDRQRVAELEAYVDEALRSQARHTSEDHQPIYVDIDCLTYHTRIRWEVMGRFRRAGWTVKEHDDQREGMSWEFMRAAQRRDR